MAKDSYRGCRDCHHPDLTSFFDNKGDGRCSSCEGTGKIHGVMDAVTSLFVEKEPNHTCEVCSGTGQCQTCGGTGYEHFYRNDLNSTENGSNESTRSTGSAIGADGDELGWGCISIFLVLTFILLLINLLGFDTRRWANQKRHDNLIYSRPNPENEHIQTSRVVSSGCQQNGTGNLVVVNPLNRKVFFRIGQNLYEDIMIEVPPFQTETINDIRANDYKYTYGYYKWNEFDHNTMKGQLSVDKCENTTFNILLPIAFWYNIGPSNWTKLNIPNDGLYAIVFPDRYSFFFKFSMNEREHYCYSYLFVPRGKETVYVRSRDSKVEISVQKVADK